jgi:hypothetical protein
MHTRSRAPLSLGVGRACPGAMVWVETWRSAPRVSATTPRPKSCPPRCVPHAHIHGQACTRCPGRTGSISKSASPPNNFRRSFPRYKEYTVGISGFFCTYTANAHADTRRGTGEQSRRSLACCVLVVQAPRHVPRHSGARIHSTVPIQTMETPRAFAGGRLERAETSARPKPRSNSPLQGAKTSFHCKHALCRRLDIASIGLWRSSITSSDILVLHPVTVPFSEPLKDLPVNRCWREVIHRRLRSYERGSSFVALSWGWSAVAALRCANMALMRSMSESSLT